MIADGLSEMIDDCEAHRLTLLQGVVPGADITGDGWVCEAIKVASDAGARISINYLRAILDRWKREGFKSERKRKNGNSKSLEDSFAEIDAWAAGGAS